MKSIQQLNLIVGAIDILLRGIGQVMLQNNPFSGLFILIGLFVASWAVGIVALVGVAASTLTAVLLKVDKALINAGLLGFNGVLVGIAISTYSGNYLSDLSIWKLWVLVILGAAFSTVVAMALSKLLSPWSMPALTMPFVLCAWIFAGSIGYIVIHKTGNLKDYADQLMGGAGQYTAQTWYIGVGKGFSEIFLQDSAIAGYLILTGILINSRISAAMGVTGALLSIATAMMFDATEHSIQMGLHSYNSVLTAIALGGLFIRFDWSSALYTLFGIVMTTWVSLAVGFAFYRLEFPVYTFPFVIVTWAMLLAAMNVGGLKYILPAEATTPEGNLARFAAPEKKSTKS
ncbi:MAG: urea transporter [Candidatus Nitrosoglobus sp.]